MGLVKGTNCGFVTVAPVDDPVGTEINVDTRARALKDTAPVGAVKVTEIGWWCDNETPEVNFEVAIYDHNVGDDNPENIVEVSSTNAKGTGSGWKRVTGLNIEITSETIYWMAIQLDNTTPNTQINIKSEAGEREDAKYSQTTLTDPWAASGEQNAYLLSIYAVYDTEKKRAGFGGIGNQKQILDPTKDMGIY